MQSISRSRNDYQKMLKRIIIRYRTKFSSLFNHRLNVRRCATYVLIFTLLTSMGGHWAILQGIAYAKMTFVYSQRDSLQAAVSKTFDGKHSCEMCKKISKNRQKEESPQFEFKIKIDIFLIKNHVFGLYELSPDLRTERMSHSLFNFQISPPTPPPRIYAHFLG